MERPRGGRARVPGRRRRWRIRGGRAHPGDGWLAARAASTTRDSFFQPIYAHTSPVYLVGGKPPAERAAAAAMFAGSIERALEWTATGGRFHTEAQRREVADLFRQGLEAYRGLGA